MTLVLPTGNTPDPEHGIPDSRLDRTLSDLEDFCKRMRTMGHDGDDTVMICDKFGQEYGIRGFDTTRGNIYIHRAI
jgi:3-mercaptopyruvate sulfurtransferase SseA